MPVQTIKNAMKNDGQFPTVDTLLTENMIFLVADTSENAETSVSQRDREETFPTHNSDSNVVASCGTSMGFSRSPYFQEDGKN